MRSIASSLLRRAGGYSAQRWQAVSPDRLPLCLGTRQGVIASLEVRPCVCAHGQPLRFMGDTEPRLKQRGSRSFVDASRPDPDAEWWTTTEVATYLGVHISTVSGYRRRGQMPEPDVTYGRTQLWSPQRIIDWHAKRPRPGTGGRPTHKAVRGESEGVPD